MHRLLLLLALVVTACSAVGVGAPPTDEVDPPVRVGSGPDAETRLLAQVMVTLLANEGLETELVAFSEAGDSRQALELGDIDVRVGYSGETWLEVLGRADPPSDPQQSFIGVRDHDADDGILWLRPTFGEASGAPPANATFAFVVAGDSDLQTMSQLAARLSEQPEALVCVDEEFGNRPDGLPAVLAAYSVRRGRDWLAASPDEAVRGVAAGGCLAGLTTTTDGAVWSAGLRPLQDDLRVFPAFVPLPQVREAAVAHRPRIRVALGPLAAQLTTELLGQWNGRVLAGEPVEVVAADAAQDLLVRAGRVPADVG